MSSGIFNVNFKCLLLLGAMALPGAVSFVPGFSNDTALASSVGPWSGTELRTRDTFGTNGKPLRVTWRAKPAPGNCAVTLLSIYNGDRVFSTNQGHWSEIGFEIYGGSYQMKSYDAFQTQYITYETPNDAATQRGRGHAVQHRVGEKVANIWDDKFHEFVIEWKPSPDNGSYISYRIDGVEIRVDKGGDISRLEEQLKVYAGAWISTIEGPNSWGCSDRRDRLDSTAVILDDFKIDQWEGTQWNSLVHRSYDSPDESWATFDRSTWGFESFDGTYCDSNAVWQSDSSLRLELDHHCGPDQGLIAQVPVPKGPDSTRVYQIVSRANGKCLEFGGTDPNRLDSILQRDCTASTAQQFRVQDAGNGTYNIQNQSSLFCLDVGGISLNDGAKIIPFDCTRGPNQTALITPSADGSFTTRFVHSMKCLDASVSGSDLTVQQQCNASAAQDWFYREVSQR